MTVEPKNEEQVCEPVMRVIERRGNFAVIADAVSQALAGRNDAPDSVFFLVTIEIDDLASIRGRTIGREFSMLIATPLEILGSCTTRAAPSRR